MVALTGGASGTNLVDLTAALGGELLVLAGMAASSEAGAQQVRETFVDGSAAERFGRMVAELGGPLDFVERWRDRLPASPVMREVLAGQNGFVSCRWFILVAAGCGAMIGLIRRSGWPMWR